MDKLPREIGGLLPWVAAARWYAAKGAGGRIVLHDAARVPAARNLEAGLPNGSFAAEPTWITLVDLVEEVNLAKDPGGRAEAASRAAGRFLIPLVVHDGVLVDAARREPFVAWLLDAMFAGRPLPADHGTFQGHAVGPPDLQPVQALPVLTASSLRIDDIGGDASNTSLAVSWGEGPSVVVKLIRQCRAGVHPEVEVGEFLAAAPVRADAPRLLGWCAYEPKGQIEANAAPAVLAVMHERVDAPGSAWEAMLEAAVNDWSRCLALAASLGATTARLHAALASRGDIPAFSPEPWTTDAWSVASRRMAAHAEDVLHRIGRLSSTLPPRIAKELERLVAARGQVAQLVSGSAARPPDGVRIRVHGDYHLGQVLVGRDGDRCVVIDFEGEPGRSLEERREKTSAAKDVAGMCRSFDYLLRVLAKEGRRPYEIRDLESLESRFLGFYEEASRTLAAAGLPGVRWWPEERHEADLLLAIYKLDKALYELAYEADHRPDWIDVPLAALTSLMPGRA